MFYKQFFIIVSGSALLLQGCANDENSHNFWAAMAAGMAGAGNQPAYNHTPTYQAPTYYQPRMTAQFSWLEGVTVVAANGTFLGKVTKNPIESDSIGNEVGSYGSSVSSRSIFNTVGEYGSSVSSFSPWNPVTSTPPRLITSDGLRWAYLTTNQSLSPRVDPSIVVAYIKSN